MHRLVRGIREFQANVFAPQREWFERLAREQCPTALFITCSDSRIDPGLITQTEPGELFVLRNAGNLIPAYGAGGGEAATIEFAVLGLRIKDVVVCGHSRCGAIAALLHHQPLPQAMPALDAWLGHAEPTRRLIGEKCPGLGADELQSVATQANVLLQMQNLRTHPVVAYGLRRGGLRLHGWVYQIETGEVLAYDPAHGLFVPVSEAAPIPQPV